MSVVRGGMPYRAPDRPHRGQIATRLYKVLEELDALVQRRSPGKVARTADLHPATVGRFLAVMSPTIADGRARSSTRLPQVRLASVMAIAVAVDSLRPKVRHPLKRSKSADKEPTP